MRAASITSTRGVSQNTLFWAYAASFGAAWGSLEILVGSFLHALRLPFSGMLLASAGAALLVAERQLLDKRGLSLATGIVAASCKSLSPGGVILGPMLGISAEAALVELALLAGASQYPTAMIAGALAALWPLCQKVLVTYVVYGGRFIDLCVTAIRKASSWIGVSETTGWWTLTGIAALLGLIGAMAGALGCNVGRECRNRMEATHSR